MTIFIVALNGLSKHLITHSLDRFVARGSVVYTDDFLIYRDIAKHGYEHKVIPRYDSPKRWVDGDTHINSAENRFSFLKPWIVRFRGLGKKCLNLWIGFFQLLFNLKLNLIGKTLKVIENLCNFNKSQRFIFIANKFSVG